MDLPEYILTKNQLEKYNRHGLINIDLSNHRADYPIGYEINLGQFPQRPLHVWATLREDTAFPRVTLASGKLKDPPQKAHEIPRDEEVSALQVRIFDVQPDRYEVELGFN